MPHDFMPGLAGVPAATSSISDVDGQRGILEYRGIRVETLCAESSYLETAYLLLFGHLPSRTELQQWTTDVTHHRRIKFRMLWRKWFPDVYLSFTSPLYIDGKLLVPQAGMKKSFVRCLDAATGNLLWEAPFTGSPSWSRQFPPVVAGKVAIYASGSGDYAPQGSEKPWTFGGTPVVPADGSEVMSFIYSNDNPYYPKNHHPRLWAWDLDTGKVVWEKDFVDQGRGGNDCGICILDGKLYYSVFFGYDAEMKMRRGLPAGNNGLTCC
ncbi:MAG TPA: citrate/2-methylcitrate synthase, partial [Nitrospira sp.]|nr:citrate/2-methylcitrate synthase [Nitrospira sp.]